LTEDVSFLLTEHVNFDVVDKTASRPILGANP
jgi:hypothetical protein